MRTVTLDVSGVSPQKEAAVYSITGIDVVEYSAKTGPGGGHANLYTPDPSALDYEITGPLSVKLRAERAGNSQGRTYIVHLRATDCSGEYGFETSVKVPHDKGQ